MYCAAPHTCQAKTAVTFAGEITDKGWWAAVATLRKGKNSTPIAYDARMQTEKEFRV